MGQAFPPAPPGTAEPQTHEILINFSFTEGTKPLEEEPEARFIKGMMGKSGKRWRSVGWNRMNDALSISVLAVNLKLST